MDTELYSMTYYKMYNLLKYSILYHKIVYYTLLWLLLPALHAYDTMHWVLPPLIDSWIILVISLFEP